MKTLARLSCVGLCLFSLLLFQGISWGDPYETEPNNNKSEADALESDEPIIGQCSSNEDEDWFYICTGRADLIETTFKLHGEKRCDWDVSIEDSYGNLLSHIVHYGFLGEATESNFVTAVTEGNIYYAKIESRCNTKEPYTLNVSISEPGECPGEPPQYDVTGIWQIAAQNQYLSLYITGTTAIAVTYIPGAGESYMLGSISGKTGRITYASDLSQFNATFTFTSATTATIIVNECIPFSGDYCIFPAGTAVSAKKIF